MSAPDYVILMTMLTDTEEGFLRLEAALSEINDELECGSLVWERTTSAYPSAFVPLELVMLPLEAAEAPVIQVPFFESVGKISAETVYVYPPGCPFLMPGEKSARNCLKLFVTIGQVAWNCTAWRMKLEKRSLSLKINNIKTEAK